MACGRWTGTGMPPEMVLGAGPQPFFLGGGLDFRRLVRRLRLGSLPKLRFRYFWVWTILVEN